MSAVLKPSASFPHVDKASGYARDVVAKKIAACKWVRAACQRHIDDLKKSRTKDYPFRFDEAAAEKFCEFAEELPHVKGKWEKKKELLKLEPWQCFIGCMIFGWLYKSSGLRRFRKVYAAIPRKNGKSILAAAIGLFMWIMDGESGAEVYSGATTEKQAWEVFRPAKKMLEKTPDLIDYAGGNSVIRAKALITDDDESRFEPVIGKPGDGASPSCAIVDEYHEHDTSDLVDTMTTGMLAREHPLLLMITTAGYNLAGPCYDEELSARQMLDGAMPNEAYFAIIYTIDDDDDWADPKVLAKANPNLGISVDAETLAAEQRQAVLNPIHQNRFKTKHLNIWCSARLAWMPLQQWNLCGDAGLKLEEFKGEPAWFILDLASKDDIACFAMMFKKRLRDQDHYYTFARYYVPEDALGDSENPNAGAYRKWHAMGLIQTTEGAEIDFDVISADVVAYKSQFQVREIIYDPWRATQLAHQLQKVGAEVVEFKQQVQTMSAPMKEVLSAVKGCRLHHDGNQVTMWMVSNVTAKIDAKDNIYPRKEKPQMKIDGAVAIIMGMARAFVDTGGATIDAWLNDPVSAR